MKGEDGQDARDLLEEARTGDAEAKDRLFARYRNYVAILARASMPRRLQPKLDASDVVQDVFVRAHRALPTFRGRTEDEFVAWLRKILANQLADAHRTFVDNQGRAVHRERPLEDCVERSSRSLRALPAASGLSPSAGAMHREVGALVADALAALKDDDREVIVLRSLEDLEWSEVARRMNRTPEAARALWGRAFQRLGAVAEERRWSPP
jgi:RNA polymerase sigma-70 factor (ECF subfamily)